MRREGPVHGVRRQYRRPAADLRAAAASFRPAQVRVPGRAARMGRAARAGGVVMVDSVLWRCAPPPRGFIGGGAPGDLCTAGIAAARPPAPPARGPSLGRVTVTAEGRAATLGPPGIRRHVAS